MTGETMTIVGEEPGYVTVGVLMPSCRVQIAVDSCDLTFEELEHVDMFIDWVQEAKKLALSLTPEREGDPS